MRERVQYFDRRDHAGSGKVINNMNLCSGKCKGINNTYHDDIAYEVDDCPLCQTYAEIDLLNKQIEDLKDEIKDLQP
jgi:hypothetical protein